MTKTSPAPTNTSVENAFAVLGLFSTATDAVALSDIARMLDIPLSTAHRVVTTLCAAEFLVQQYAGGPYTPGIRVQELLNALYNRYPIRRRAATPLRALADGSGQGAVLYVRFGSHCLRIAGAQDRKQIHRPLLIGEALPLIDSPYGQVILAHQPSPPAQLQIPHRSDHLSVVVGALRSVTFPLLDRGDRAFAAVAVEGSTLEFSEPSARKIAQWGEIVSELQAQCRDNPDWTVNPFDGVATGRLRLPEDHRPEFGGSA